MKVFSPVTNTIGLLFNLGLLSHAFQWIEASFLTERLFNYFLKRIVHLISAIPPFFFERQKALSLSASSFLMVVNTCS